MSFSTIKVGISIKNNTDISEKHVIQIIYFISE